MEFRILTRAWLDQRRFKPTRTYAQYESQVEKHIIKPLGEAEIGELTPWTSPLEPDKE